LDYGLQKQATAVLHVQVVNLQSQLGNLTAENNELQNEKAFLLSQETDLQTQVENLINQTRFLQSENSNLTSSMDSLRLNLLHKPNLVTRLGVTDVKEKPEATSTFRPRLFVQGYVFNTGGAIARNAQLHVTLFIGEQAVKDVYLELGNLEPLSGVYVEENIHYGSSGARLTRWSIVPEATS
jgi:hypothetical protein